MRRTAMSLFVDDTHARPIGAFSQLMEFCEAQGLRGKVSLIPAWGLKPGQPLLGESTEPAALDFMAELARVGARGFDVHMELMTHDKLWDFAAGAMRQDGTCEGIWLYDPEVPVEAYEAYLGGILDHARAGGVTINGISVPGCDCESCEALTEKYLAGGHTNISHNAWQAVLNLAEAGRFGVPVVAVYSDEADARHPTQVMAERAGFGVYDCRLDISTLDQIGFDGIDIDFYISEDGKAGRIPELVQSGAAQCFFCAHWFSMNPGLPEGWGAFQEIVRRINATLADRVEWVKPSEYGQRLLDGSHLVGAGARRERRLAGQGGQ